MKIKKIISQHRRDFSAIMICEHCENEEINKYGYDDDNYHNNVIPSMECKVCGKKSPESYTPASTKYPKNFVI
jgi:hypothetical protein